MKRYICLASAAIVATMLFSCKKLENNTQPSTSSTVKMELTASTDTPATKVTIGDKSGTKYPVTWDAEGESVVMYEVQHSAEGVNSVSVTSDGEYTLSQDKRTARFTFSLEESEAQSYDYLFVYPSSTGFNKTQNPMTLTLSLPLSQTSLQNSADPKSVYLFSSVMKQTYQPTSFSTNFQTISAIGKMTLKNLPIEPDEIIENVSITADGKVLSGKNWFVFEDGSFNKATSGTNDNISVDVKSITTSSNFTFWFSCWPCSFVDGDKLIIVATTDKTTYTREITMTARELKAGNVNDITVDMSSAEKPAADEIFTLTDLEAIQAGDVVVITMLKDDTYYAMTNNNGTTSGPSAPVVDVKDNTIKNPASIWRWNIYSSEGAYTIRPAKDENNNLYTTKSNNGVRVGTTAGSWTLDGNYLKYSKKLDGDDDYRYLGVYIATDNNWRAYTNTTGNIKDQKVCFFAYRDSREPQPLSFPQTSYEVELGETFNAPKVDGVKTTVKYSSSNTDVATVNESNGAVTIIAAGTTTITATAEASSTYQAGYASYILTVTSAIQTMDEIFAAATTAGSTATTVKVKFNNWVISGAKGKNAYATDGTKGFIIYTDGHGFVAGDKLSGTVTCKVQLFKGAAQLTEITSSSEGLTVSKGGTITAQNATIAELSGVNTGAYFNLGTLTYDGTDFTDGTNKIQPYNSVIDLPKLTKGMNYKVKGMFLQYGSKKEIAPLYVTDFEEAEAPDPTCATPEITIDGSGKATITCATEGATIKYAISNTEPASFTNTYSSPVQLSDGQTIWAKATKNGHSDSEVVSKTYTSGGQGGNSKTLIIDGSQLSASATTAVKDYTFGDFTITMSDGAKVQTSSGDNRFTDNAILIGKSDKYIYNKTPIGKKITKFEIYANKGASQKVTVGVVFSTTAISEYVEGVNTYTAKLDNLDSVYDCSSKIPEGAKYFWYQVTNANNSQVQFRITYEEE